MNGLSAAKVVAIAAFALAVSACGACGKSSPGGGPNAAPGESSSSPEPRASREAGIVPRDSAMWDHAKDGDVEDLATLAASEGAAGLVEAADEDPGLRATALRAMGYAHGWAQLPYLAKTAAAPDDESAQLAVASIVELASRPRRAEDPEDQEELEDGCKRLATLAKDATRPRVRRVATIRALRMMPCPKLDLPADVDTH